MLYGLATALMWIRTLNFVMIQKDLGQVPRPDTRLSAFAKYAVGSFYQMLQYPDHGRNPPSRALCPHQEMVDAHVGKAETGQAVFLLWYKAPG